jgi:hypothetical protein
MDLSQFDNHQLDLVNGTSGQPQFSLEDSAEGKVMKLSYIRRTDG